MKADVVLGLSGGVDSAVAGALLREEGLAVHCVYLDNGVESGEDARRTAEALGCSFEVVSIAGELEREVCRPFAEAYLAGRTPSPCALCNPRVKFPTLLEAADRVGARWAATGHYARSVEGGLYRGRSANDQSYMLARLTREQLRRVRFPLGDWEKTAVRARAAALGLAAAERPDSMEICFIPENDYGDWLARRGPVPGPGEFVDKEGRVLGQHRGYYRYTLGQGRGLGVAGPHRYYVSAILPEENRVVLSDGKDLDRQEVRCGGMNWLEEPLWAPGQVTARFRHSRNEVGCTLTPQGDGTVLVRTAEPVRAPTPGQLGVFYRGERVMGSGWIV